MCLSFYVKRDKNRRLKTDESNDLKTKAIGSENCMSHINAEYGHVDEFQKILRKGEVALIIPVANERPERGASPVNWIKTRTRNTMEIDLLNSLLIKSKNDPFLVNKT